MLKTKLFVVIAILFSTLGCVHPKIGLNRGKLLDPMMDPSKSSGFYSSFVGEPTMVYENGSSFGSGGSGGSCPTCGG
jgi:hypothetical protein